MAHISSPGINTSLIVGYLAYAQKSSLYWLCIMLAVRSAFFSVLMLYGAAALACFEQADGSTPKLVIPLQEPTKLAHNQFFLTLLPQLLERSQDEYGPCELQFFGEPLSHERISALIAKNRYLSMNWASTAKDREHKLRAIKEPLLKGLMGFRVMILHSDNKHALRHVKTPTQLKQFSFGLGGSWPDVDVMKANGFKVITTSSYELLFRMLSAGRFDLLSRGFNEAIPEAKLHEHKNITVDPYITVVYPLPVYFFINRDNNKLAERIASAIAAMRADGSFDNIFYADPDIAKSLDDLRLEERTKIYLCNPSLPADVPFDRPELWHYPINNDACRS